MKFVTVQKAQPFTVDKLIILSYIFCMSAIAGIYNISVRVDNCVCVCVLNYVITLSLHDM